MDRRDFIKRVSGTTGLIIASTGAGAFLHNRGKHDSPTIRFSGKDFVVEDNPDLPKVTACKHPDPVKALNAALTAIGGISRFIQTGDKVLIKPNVAWDRTPEQAANTHPALVAEMTRLCLEAGAGEVVVSDVTCNDPRRTFIRSGIKEAAEAAGATVTLMEDNTYQEVAIDGEFVTVWPVMKPLLNADKLINMPVVKHHSLATCTIGMKNLYGIVGGRRNKMHQQIEQSIVDLATFAVPTLTVIDATRVLMRNGPQGGDLADVETPETVLCATDIVAGDARACQFLGLKAEEVGHIVAGEKAGLGTMDYEAAGYVEVTA